MAEQPKKPTAGKKPPKNREDLNTLAARIVAEAVGNAPKMADPDAGKDPTAVALGRKGELKGGKARAANLSKEQRSASAKKASRARWGKEAK